MTTRNNCDGCIAKMPVCNGIHYNPTTNKIHMACTKDRYTETNHHAIYVDDIKREIEQDFDRDPH